MGVQRHLEAVQSGGLQCLHKLRRQIHTVGIEPGDHLFRVADQLRKILPHGGLAAGEGYHGDTGGLQTVDGLLPLVGGRLPGLAHLLPRRIAEQTFLIAPPFAVPIRHGTDHQIHPMGCGHVIPVCPDGQLLNLRIGIISPGHGKEHLQKLLKIFCDGILRNGRIYPADTADRLVDDVGFVCFRDGLPVKFIDFLHEAGQEQRPGISDGQQIISVEDHDVGTGAQQSEFGRDQMNPHDSGPLRVEGAVADAVSIFAVLGNLVL